MVSSLLDINFYFLFPLLTIFCISPIQIIPEFYRPRTPLDQTFVLLCLQFCQNQLSMYSIFSVNSSTFAFVIAKQLLLINKIKPIYFYLKLNGQ